MAIHLPPGMNHVERRELYTNFQARLTYLHSFIEFGNADVEILRLAQPFFKSIIPSLAERVYTKMLSNDLTGQSLITQSTRQECDLDAEDFYDQKSQNVKARSMSWRWYLTKLNSDPTTTAYWEYMNKVGAMHNRYFRRRPLEIDVIHFSMMIGHLQNMINDAILDSNQFDNQQKKALVKAWGKLFWIQNDLFTKWYVKDGDEYDQLSPGALKLQWNEALGRDGEVMKDDNGQAMGGCPFATMAKVQNTETGGRTKNGYVYNAQP